MGLEFRLRRAETQEFSKGWSEVAGKNWAPIWGSPGDKTKANCTWWLAGFHSLWVVGLKGSSFLTLGWGSALVICHLDFSIWLLTSLKPRWGEPSNHTENPLRVQQNHGSKTTSPAGAGSQTQVSWKGVGGTALSSRFWVWRYRIFSVFLYCLYLIIWHIWVLIFLLICMHFGSLRKLVSPYNIVFSSPKLKRLNIFKDHLHPSCTLGST